MKSERIKVDFPLWRKKVDSSIFELAGTAIPKWVCKMWDIHSQFGHVRSIKHNDSVVTIKFAGRKYRGHVSYRKQNSNQLGARLTFEDRLCVELKKRYLMSYMRDIERRLRDEGLRSDIESEIPFWEFLDIEYNNDPGTFFFTQHYAQRPQFPVLFERLV